MNENFLLLFKNKLDVEKLIQDAIDVEVRFEGAKALLNIH